MTPGEWAQVLASCPAGEAGDEDRRVALSMLSDEDWLSEEGASFLREAARRRRPLCPAGTHDTFAHWGDEDLPGVVSSLRRVPAWAVDAMGRVDSRDNPARHGPFTRNRADAAVAWAELLEALAAGRPK